MREPDSGYGLPGWARVAGRVATATAKGVPTATAAASTSEMALNPATRRANKRMGKLMKRLQRDPDNRDLKAELWLRCREFQQHGSVVWRWNSPNDVMEEVGAAIELQERIEAELSRQEIVDRIQHMIDPLEAKAIRSES